MPDILHITESSGSYRASENADLFVSTPYVHIGVLRGMVFELEKAISRIEKGRQYTDDLRLSLDSIKQTISAL